MGCILRLIGILSYSSKTPIDWFFF